MITLKIWDFLIAGTVKSAKIVKFEVFPRQKNENHV